MALALIPTATAKSSHNLTPWAPSRAGKGERFPSPYRRGGRGDALLGSFFVNNYALSWILALVSFSLAGPEKMSAKTRTCRAVSTPDIGWPCPGASTHGSSPARILTDSFAARQFQVKYHGGSETLCLLSPRPHDMHPRKEFKSTVTMASPVIKTRSPVRKKATWPGV